MLKDNYTIDDVMHISPIMPVISIENAKDSIDLAYALIEGGVNVLEITLRTEAALDAIKILSQEVKDVVVGAGTVLNTDDLKKVQDAGAKFAISPGITPNLLQEAKTSNFPFLPGIATGSEIMQGLEMGYNRFKLFPAITAGGIGALKSFSGPFQQVKFCPTGGINENNFQEFLALPNVLCIGGSWIASKSLIESKGYRKITEITKNTISLVDNY